MWIQLLLSYWIVRIQILPGINNIFKELKQRKVFRSLAIYAGASFIILQVCSIVFPALLLPDWSMRLVVILLIIGFPTLIIFSWIYDVTPEGVVKTETNRSSSKTNYSIFILIVIVGGGLLFFFQDRLFKPAVNPKSVAVLPFDNYSPNPDDKYLSAGFTEVIIANLAKIKDLLVISKQSEAFMISQLFVIQVTIHLQELIRMNFGLILR